ncbi:uncharacterized protein LOC132278712 isoform X2 [Cornus florida]|uniref:uncharacterized protein LOC132278712 isoform X2 n=1 Tax=Cornus florida TaxID=4283 RepID=UPI00289D0572|nr:uncharacterized protein LOC132278712 isoform X2 [Cornus florida]
MKKRWMRRSTRGITTTKATQSQWFTNCIDATDVESNAFSTDEPILVGRPGILEHAEIALRIKKGMPPKSDLSGFKHLFLVEKHNIILENYGLYKKGNTDWNVAGGSKLRYISIEDFMWWFYRIPGKYNKGIYNYMFKQQIYVLENCAFTVLEHPVIICSWQPPFDGWYKLNVSGFFKENLDGTIEASCGQVLRDSWGMVLERFHKPLPDATSRDEAFILGVHHGIYEILQRRSEAKNIILEIDHKIIFNVLSRFQHLRFDHRELYLEIFTLLSKFDKYEISFRYSQGNGLAKRVAYIASHLTMGQSFPTGDKGYETQVKCDQWKIPRYEIALEKRNEVEESCDEDIEGENRSRIGFPGDLLRKFADGEPLW